MVPTKIQLRYEGQSSLTYFTALFVTYFFKFEIINKETLKKGLIYFQIEKFILLFIILSS